MSKLIDLTGQQFGRLTVVQRAETGKRGHALWLCKCACGRETIVSSSSLRRGATKSCGGWQSEICRRRMIAINTKHGGKGTRLYRIWHGMKQRCYNPKSDHYNLHGGRGIGVCAEWLHDFAVFQKWALPQTVCLLIASTMTKATNRITVDGQQLKSRTTTKGAGNSL